MRVEQQATPADVVGLGIAFAATGLYFLLAALDLLPLPDAGRQAPSFLIALTGASFLFAGGMIAYRARAGTEPASGPAVARTAPRIATIAITGSLAAIVTFMAIGSGPRAISLAGLTPAGEALGHAALALGAVIVWIYAIVLAVGLARTLLDRAGR
jgi:hypothetical protein